MASLSPKGRLKTKHQIRYRDRERSPQEVTDSLWKRGHAPTQEQGYTRTEAKREADYREALYRRGEYDPWTEESPSVSAQSRAGEHMTLLAAVRRYVEEKRNAGERGERHGWGEETHKRYKPTLERFAKDTAPSRSVTRLTETKIRSWVYREDLSHESKRTYYRMVSAFLAWLREKRIADLSMPPELETRSTVPSWASREQLVAIVSAWEDVCREDANRNSDPSVTFPGDTRWWMQAAWRLSFWQALRRSEVLKIRCGSVDLEDRSLLIGGDYITKGKADATIPLVGPAAEIAREWGAGERPDGERLFGRSQADKVSRGFTEARDRAIQDGSLDPDCEITMHSLRHGRAIDLTKKGRHIVYVSQFLRHSSLDSTREYLQVVPRHLQQEMEDLDESPIAGE